MTAQGGINAVVTALQRHEGTMRVAEQACAALANFANLGVLCVSAVVCGRVLCGSSTLLCLLDVRHGWCYAESG